IPRMYAGQLYSTYTHDTSPISYLILFLNGYVAHRDLHSFPTRRSSDLAEDEEKLAWSDVFFREVVSRFIYNLFMVFKLLYIVVRSEEHTSELQSRFDLVCRLLLEKKNNEQHT